MNDYIHITTEKKNNNVGLAVLRGIAEILEIETCFIDEVLIWAQEKIGHEYLVAGKMTGADISKNSNYKKT